MSRDPSRWLAIYAYAAILARQLEADGEIRCAYCAVPLAVADQFSGGDAREYGENEVLEIADLVRAGRCLDHCDGDDRNNESTNLVAACCDCNKAAGQHNARGNERIEMRLRGLGIKPRDAARRVKRILETEPPARNDPSTIQIANLWFGDRLQYQRDIAAKRAGRAPAERPRARRERLPF